ncbi:MAG: tetratricopeptide repeat protein [Nitrospirae bacterium]|nr:tetratricopeptide repeat protein [Nitrospirota bacterium]
MSAERNGSLLRTKRPYAWVAGAAAATLLIYLPALQNGFVNWDDPAYVYENPHIRSLGLPFFKWAFLDFHAWNWHPLTWISHGLDYAVWGLNPAGHHLSSILLHGANTFLVGMLVVEFFRARGADKEGVAITAAFVTAMLFGIHPLHVESVAWVSERKDVLCALFFLLSLLSYLRYASGTGREMNPMPFTHKYYRFAFAFFLLALLSKPMAISLPLVLLILDWYPLGRFWGRGAMRSLFAEKLPFLILSALSGIVTVLAQLYGGAVVELTDIPAATRSVIAFHALTAYLVKMVWPVDLIPYYPYPQKVSLFSFEYLLPVLFVLLVTSVCLMQSRRQKIWLAVWAYYVITLLPVLGIIKVGGQAMADRYTYLPSLGPFLLAGCGAALLYEKMGALMRRNALVKVSFFAAFALLVALYSGLTIQQVRTWKNGIALWTKAIGTLSREGGKAYINIDIPYENRGIAFKNAGRFEEALSDFSRAFYLNPNATKYHNRGYAFEKVGRFEEALADYSRAIELKPDTPDSYINRASLQARLGHLEEALGDYSRAILLKPDSSDLYYNRGNIYAKTGRYEDAVRDYTQAIQISPHPDYYRNRSIVYKSMGRDDDALNDLLHYELRMKAERGS